MLTSKSGVARAATIQEGIAPVHRIWKSGTSAIATRQHPLSQRCISSSALVHISNGFEFSLGIGRLIAGAGPFSELLITEI